MDDEVKTIIGRTYIPKKNLSCPVRTVHRHFLLKFQPILEATSPDFLKEIKQRNLERYQNESAPIIDYLREQGKTWEQIINGATRAGGGDLF